MNLGLRDKYGSATTETNNYRFKTHPSTLYDQPMVFARICINVNLNGEVHPDF